MPVPMIYETSVAPDAKGTTVQMHISDLPPDAEGAAIRIVLTARVPAFETPLLAQLQREAMKAASDVLFDLLQNLARDIQAKNRDLDPQPRQ